MDRTAVVKVGAAASASVCVLFGGVVLAQYIVAKKKRAGKKTRIIEMVSTSRQFSFIKSGKKQEGKEQGLQSKGHFFHNSYSVFIPRRASCLMCLCSKKKTCYDIVFCPLKHSQEVGACFQKFSAGNGTLCSVFLTLMGLHDAVRVRDRSLKQQLFRGHQAAFLPQKEQEPLLCSDS